ncbi:hypothetical protein [Nostocoides veronense]|uniref:hypothetical protein n=1 Tax=Nostocoides veronense TaxID=330836 RepID=UPI0031E31187
MAEASMRTATAQAMASVTTLAIGVIAARQYQIAKRKDAREVVVAELEVLERIARNLLPTSSEMENLWAVIGIQTLYHSRDLSPGNARALLLGYLGWSLGRPRTEASNLAVRMVVSELKLGRVLDFRGGSFAKYDLSDLDLRGIQFSSGATSEAIINRATLPESPAKH